MTLHAQDLTKLIALLKATRAANMAQFRNEIKFLDRESLSIMAACCVSLKDAIETEIDNKSKKTT